MAHFAEIDENNIVKRVVVVGNSDIMLDGVESELLGIELCQNLLGGNWVQTSYNSNFRKRYAGIGYYYDSVKDAFITPKPFDSWILNETTLDWEAPVSYPDDGGYYNWNENQLTWDLIQS